MLGFALPALEVAELLPAFSQMFPSQLSKFLWISSKDSTDTTQTVGVWTIVRAACDVAPVRYYGENCIDMM